MKYLTKGELLPLLGDSSSSFTAFMIGPETFGVTEPTLTELRVAKQKLDWTSGINIELPEVQELISMLEMYGAISNLSADAVRNTPDRKDADDYIVTIQGSFLVMNLGAAYVKYLRNVVELQGVAIETGVGTDLPFKDVNLSYNFIQG